MAGVKHLALDLSGTEHGGVLLKKREEHENVFDRWIESGDWMEFDTKKQKTKPILNLDVFAGSSWGDDRGTRKSTSFSTVFFNGAYVLGFSRTQATVALSSCEAELYAANAGLVLMRLCKYFLGDEKDGTTEVKMKLFSDSSSALGTIQKSGVGRMKHIEIRHLYLQVQRRQLRSNRQAKPHEVLSCQSAMSSFHKSQRCH